ncbi:hypothetical protein GOP47_0004126 [Adiantum capillus-veneris]|uniref:HTH three-helical bundle domain-containing protein n=1 Tax=Adiantum capillus-veneris TaxID=13818 RepID=A0A9D4V884_ADICA|nr:hypothetical protein GOP47_0004126 [Adiantum capillus-veneris]
MQAVLLTFKANMWVVWNIKTLNHHLGGRRHKAMAKGKSAKSSETSVDGKPNPAANKHADKKRASDTKPETLQNAKRQKTLTVAVANGAPTNTPNKKEKSNKVPVVKEGQQKGKSTIKTHLKRQLVQAISIIFFKHPAYQQMQHMEICFEIAKERKNDPPGAEMHQPHCMERPLSAPSPADRHHHPPFPFSLPFATPSMAPSTVPLHPTHANVFLHFSVSNSVWLAGAYTGGAHQDAPVLTNSTISFEPSSSMAPSTFFFSSAPAAGSCCPQSITAPSSNDLLQKLHPHNFQSVGEVSESITSAPASSGLASTDSKAAASTRVRLRILNPQKMHRSSKPADQASQQCSSISVDCAPLEAPFGFGLPMGSWHGIKKSRSKRRRFCTWGPESASSSRPEPAVQKCSSWCSNEVNTVQKSSPNSIDAASCSVAEVSTEQIGSVMRSSESGESDLDWTDRISWHRRELTSKLDQLAFIACELKAKRRRSPRKQIRRHHYTTETFSPLTLIDSYWRQNSTNYLSAKQAAENFHNGSALNLAKAKDAPFSCYIRRSPLQSFKGVKTGAVPAPPAFYTADRAAKCASTRRVIRKAKTIGRQTRVQRCAKQVLDFVGKDTVREKLIRHALGNNPDTSKALRLLLDQRKLGRIGGGGRRDPYKYKLTPDGLHELSEKTQNSNMPQLSSAASTTSAGEELSVDNNIRTCMSAILYKSLIRDGS